jgi:tryptophan-rich sensory protein
VLAAIDIVFIRWTIVWSMIVVYPYLHRVTYMQIPYLLRVSIATILQLTITSINRK